MSYDQWNNYTSIQLYNYTTLHLYSYTNKPLHTYKVDEKKKSQPMRGDTPVSQHSYLNIVVQSEKKEIRSKYYIV